MAVERLHSHIKYSVPIWIFLEKFKREGIGEFDSSEADMFRSGGFKYTPTIEGLASVLEVFLPVLHD